MTTYQKVLKKLNVESAIAFKNDVQTDSTYYVFTANCVRPAAVTSPIDSFNSDIDTFRNILFGNKIKPSNIRLMAKRYDWTINTVYSIYDPADTDLSSKMFYVVASDGLNYNVYKCLNNNGGAPSTVAPFGTDAEPIYSVDDGYVWKYMYTIDNSTFRIFATDNFIPVDDAQNDMNISSLGGIEVIAVDPLNPGSGYNNYTVGVFETSASINYNNSPVQYLLDSTATAISGFYIGCLIKATSASTHLSEYRTIVDYIIDGSNRIAVLDSKFDIALKASDQYEIYPNVIVQDLNNTSSNTCIARAIISANTGNSVSTIEVINPGSNYRKVGAYVAIDPSVGLVKSASLNPIVSPVNGHGSNMFQELFANRVCLSSTFSGNTGILLTDNGFGTVGVMRDPMFANVNVMIDTSSLIGKFAVGESIYRYKSYTLNGNVSVQSGNTTIVSDDSSFGTSLRISDRVIVTNGQQNLFANVATIIDTNTVMLDQSPFFTDANTKVKVVQASPFGEVSNYDFFDVLNLTNVLPSHLDSTTTDLVGIESNSTATINAVATPYITIGDRSANMFEQFTQLTKLVGTINTDTPFINSETIYQGNTQSISAPTATLFAAKNEVGINGDILYVTNQTNDFTTDIITGQTSGSTFTYQYKYDGELVKNSGDIVYLENLNYITRSDDQSETCKIILEF